MGHSAEEIIQDAISWLMGGEGVCVTVDSVD